MSAVIDGSQRLGLSSSRFRAARQGDWERLEMLLRQIEKGAASSLSDEDLFELPVLYRATLSSLSVARETSLDADMVGYLESLSTRAYFILYGVHAPLHVRLAGFIARDWPEAVRTLWRETLVALLLMVLGALAAYLLVRSDPSWFYSIVDDGFAAGRNPTATADELRRTLYDGGDEFLGGFATYLFTHNSQVSLMCFALGFAFAIPTVLLLVWNGCILGAFLAVYVQKGLGWQLGAWLAIHGTTELFAIGIAGAAGIRIGMAIAFPGQVSRMDSAKSAGRVAAYAMLGVIVMLFFAGLLEGFGRQLINDDMMRAGIGAAMLLIWLVYFYVKPIRGEAARG